MNNVVLIPFRRPLAMTFLRPARIRWTRLATRTAAALAAVVILSFLVGRDLISPGNVFAIVETGSLFKVEDGKFEAIKVGEKVDTGTRVRTDDSSAVLKLPDGARIEMQEMSELTLEHAQDGVHIRLDDGSVRVTSARQPAAPLYVQNKNVTVPVVGTVFQSTAALPIPAQNAAEPRLTFEVFSVRPTGAAPGGGRGTGGGGSPRPVEEPCGNPRGTSPQSSLFIQLDGRRFAAHDMTLHALIAIAYSHECSIWRGSDALLGGPGWTKTAGYDVEANIPDGTPVYTKVQLLDGQAPQIQKMLQELLADSFKLVLRRETREVSGLVLTVANAAKLAPWKPGDPATVIEWQQKTGMIQSEREAAQRGAQLGQQDRYVVPRNQDTVASGDTCPQECHGSPGGRSHRNHVRRIQFRV